MKKRFIIKKILVLAIVLSIGINYSCNQQNNEVLEAVPFVVDDLDEIRERGKLVVVTDFNSVNYYIYEGQPMGFQYELLQELSDYLALPFEVKINNDLQQNFESLYSGECDLIALNLAITLERKEQMDFTIPHSQSRQVLIQRVLPKRSNSIRNHDLIKDPFELGNKTIYVQKASAFVYRLKNLSEEIGEQINVVEVPYSTEQLIKMVAEGQIDYTVADENVAIVNKKHFPGIDVETPISLLQNHAWAVSRGAEDLLKEIDTWLESFKKTTKYAVLYHKYFKSKFSANVVKSEFYYSETGKISYYDEILKTESGKIGWDWRLLASMIYEESRFKPSAISHAGAFGIMQFMPQTAERFGVDINSSPEDQIRAGVKYIDWIDRRLASRIEDKNERIKFVLASYNVGLGHILDAINLAEKYGGNTQIWEGNVESYFLKKSDPIYYNDEVVRNGYCKGTETFKYVRKIMYRYNHYLNIEPMNLAQLSPQVQ